MIKHIGEFTIEEIFPLIEHNKDVVLMGYKVHTFTNKMKIFKRSQRCSYCGRIGTVFSLDVQVEKGIEHSVAYLTLCRISSSGKLHPMTVDHIIPKAVGGPNDLDNLQTMCKCCNKSKTDRVQTKYFNEKSWEIITEKNLAPKILEHMENQIKTQFRMIIKMKKRSKEDNMPISI